MILAGIIDRYVLHLDLDTFFVSVERLKNSRLNGKPVIIGGMSDRGVVSSCSYEARKYGVSSAMPMKMARNMCPDAIVIRGDLQKRIPYTSFDHVLADIAKELFGRLYQRRMLIRLIGVRFSHMVRGVQQLDLFDDTPEKVSLYMAMDKLRKRFGRNAVRRASGVMTISEREEKALKQLENALKEQNMMEERLRGYWY